MRCLTFLIVALLASCGPTPKPPPDPPPAQPCEPSSSEKFEIGVVVPDSRRWFRAFDDGCDTIEMQTGLQGGWHVEPAIQAPTGATEEDLGGLIVWEVFADGEDVARAEVEMFRSFWQPLEGGLAYWGDFVIFNADPGALLDTEIEVRLSLTFDEQSRYDDVEISETVLFVNEEGPRNPE